MEKYTDCYVIYHKEVPYGIWSNEIWTPLQVGVENHGKITEYGGCYDNEGDNISIWNPNFAELTGLYWIWSNLTGKKYQPKRNHISYFMKNNNWSYERLTVDNIPECLHKTVRLP